MLEGSVDRVIYRDYKVNRRFLFTIVWPHLRRGEQEVDGERRMRGRGREGEGTER